MYRCLGPWLLSGGFLGGGTAGPLHPVPAGPPGGGAAGQVRHCRVIGATARRTLVWVAAIPISHPGHGCDLRAATSCSRCWRWEAGPAPHRRAMVLHGAWWLVSLRASCWPAECHVSGHVGLGDWSGWGFWLGMRGWWNMVGCSRWHDAVLASGCTGGHGAGPSLLLARSAGHGRRHGPRRVMVVVRGPTPGAGRISAGSRGGEVHVCSGSKMGMLVRSG